jgi:hypothetical protein
MTATEWDRLYELLAEEYRRRVLCHLLERGDAGPPLQVPQDVLAPAEDPVVVRQRLCHCDLPKLERARVIEWDREQELVGRGAQFSNVVPLLEQVRDDQPALPAGWVHPEVDPWGNGDEN